MILIISSAKDVHAKAVSLSLKKHGYVAKIVDSQQFGRKQLIVDHIGRDRETKICFTNGETINLRQVDSIWNRRARKPLVSVDITDPDDQNFVQSEWGEVLASIFRQQGLKIINSPMAERYAVKPIQLTLAQKCGLNIPETLVTNDAEAVCEFLDRHNGRIIHKALTAPEHIFLETREWTNEDHKYLVQLGACPTIFQEKISGRYDVRSTVVGNHVFSALIHTYQSRSGIDSRLDIDILYEPYKLPSIVENNLQKLMKELGLFFATVDFKIAESGEYFFLELNPQGQFLYIEIKTGLPIANAVADLLATDVR